MNRSMMISGVLSGVTEEQLCLSRTLITGQNFRWKHRPIDVLHDTTDEYWVGVLDNRFVVGLQQQPTQIVYRLYNTIDHLKSVKTLSKAKLRTELEHCLRHYFRLDEDIDTLYTDWARRDGNFARVASQYKGIRLLRQSVNENIFSFICSSNNHIGRISKMIETLCRRYGSKLYSFDNKNDDNDDIYSFPSIEALANDGVETELRSLAFGYRASFIAQAAKMIVAAGTSQQWIERLRKLSYDDAKRELMSLPGIGAKVADCICLMSLDHTKAIPVDTHVYQITVKYYLPQLANSGKSLTTKRYNQIGDFYREKFEIHPGWAQTVLFCSHLKQPQPQKSKNNTKKNK